MQIFKRRALFGNQTVVHLTFSQIDETQNPGGIFALSGVLFYLMLTETPVALLGEKVNFWQLLLMSPTTGPVSKNNVAQQDRITLGR